MDGDDDDDAQAVSMQHYLSGLNPGCYFLLGWQCTLCGPSEEGQVPF